MARVLRSCALSALLAVPVAVSAQAAATNPGVGFRSVAEALAAVKARPGAKLTVTQPDAWTVITEQNGSVVWSFTPAGHPAHPAVVRRSLDVGDDGIARIDMAMLCQSADKPSCDQLAKDFRTINERSMRGLRERMKNVEEDKPK